MANPSKQRGTKFETDTVKFARAAGFPDAARLALAGREDRGDLVLVGTAAAPRIVIECKYRAQPVSDAQVITWLGDTERERIAAGAEYAFLVMNRPRKPIDHAWAVELNMVGGAPRPVFRYLSDHLAQLLDDGWTP